MGNQLSDLFTWIPWSSLLWMAENNPSPREEEKSEPSCSQNKTWDHKIYLMLYNLKLAQGHCLALTSHSAANPDHSDATVMPQWCHSDVTVMPQWCHSDVTVMPQWCHSDATVMSQWCHSDVTVMPQWCHSVMSASIKSLKRLWVFVPAGGLDLHTTLSMFLNSCKTVNDKN